MYNIIVRCGSGGTGRRARLRGVWFYRTGSIPVSRTNKKDSTSRRVFFVVRRRVQNPFPRQPKALSFFKLMPRKKLCAFARANGKFQALAFVRSLRALFNFPSPAIRVIFCVFLSPLFLIFSLYVLLLAAICCIITSISFFFS